MGKKVKDIEKVSSGEKFFIGAEEIFNEGKAADATILGVLRGKISVGDEVVLTNPGADEESSRLVSKILEIRIGLEKEADSAADCIVAVKLEKVSSFDLRVGTVCCSENAEEEEIRNSYLNAIGNAYITNKNCDLSDKDFAAMSLRDCVEIWKLYASLHLTILKEEDVEVKRETSEKIGKIINEVCAKLLEAKELLCVFGKNTEKPYLFSRTMKGKNDYIATPPDIRVYPLGYEKLIKNEYPEDKYVIKKLKNSDDGKDFYEFFGNAFYADGACGVDVIYAKTCIADRMLITPPDFSKLDPEQYPVINPELVRWMTLMGQIGRPATEEDKISFSLYSGYASVALMKASFIVPVKKKDEKGQSKDSEGNDQLIMPSVDMKQGRPALCIFTDRSRVMEVYPDWSATIMPLKDIIDKYDAAINLQKNGYVGMYIDAARYNSMANFVESLKK